MPSPRRGLLDRMTFGAFAAGRGRLRAPEVAALALAWAARASAYQAGALHELAVLLGRVPRRTVDERIDDVWRALLTMQHELVDARIAHGPRGAHCGGLDCFAGKVDVAVRCDCDCVSCAAALTLYVVAKLMVLGEWGDE